MRRTAATAQLNARSRPLADCDYAAHCTSLGHHPHHHITNDIVYLCARLINFGGQHHKLTISRANLVAAGWLAGRRLMQQCNWYSIIPWLLFADYYYICRPTQRALRGCLRRRLTLRSNSIITLTVMITLGTEFDKSHWHILPRIRLQQTCVEMWNDDDSLNAYYVLRIHFS